MKKKIVIFVLMAMVLALALPAFATEQRVFDYGNQLTPAQETVLEEEIEKFREETKMDFVFLTSTEPIEDGTQQDIADDFYDKYGFGVGDERSGLLYYIDMYNRYQHVSTTGAMIDYITGERLERIDSAAKQYLRDDDCYQAAAAVLTRTQAYVKEGIPEEQFRYDVVTGEKLTARHKALTAGEIGLSAIIGAVVMFIAMGAVKHSYLLKGKTYDYNFRDNSTVKMTDSKDDYIRTTTTRTRRQQSSSGGSSSSDGGYSGGSGVHTSSSGTTHGGGGSHF